MVPPPAFGVTWVCPGFTQKALEKQESQETSCFILLFGQGWGAMTDIGIMYYIGSMIEESCNIMYHTLQMAKT